MRDAVEPDAAHQPAERDTDRLLPRRFSLILLSEDVAALARVRDELGAQLGRQRDAAGLAFFVCTMVT
jgi:hypothetical protein